MIFNLEKSIQILERTPVVLYHLVQNLSQDWTHNNEGADSWNVPDVIGHLIYCDTENWLLRTKHILNEGDSVPLPPFDRFAHLQLYQHHSLSQLVEQFKNTRESTLAEVRKLINNETDFNKKGLHPQFGEVVLSQLLSAWVVHDLSHHAQINRIIAKQYSETVGPWIQFLKILNQP